MFLKMIKIVCTKMECILLGLFLLQISLNGSPQNKISNKSLITGLEVMLTLVHGIKFVKKKPPLYV